jgi:hypothetical protein
MSCSTKHECQGFAGEMIAISGHANAAPDVAHRIIDAPWFQTAACAAASVAARCNLIS